MIDRRGAVETARALISKEEGSHGFTNLFLIGRLDLTVEALVLRDDFKEFFTGDERNGCRNKLKRANYKI